MVSPYKILQQVVKLQKSLCHLLNLGRVLADQPLCGNFRPPNLACNCFRGRPSCRRFALPPPQAVLHHRRIPARRKLPHRRQADRLLPGAISVLVL